MDLEEQIENDSEWISTKLAAEIIGLTGAVLRYHCRQKIIGGKRLGRTLYLKVRDLLDYVPTSHAPNKELTLICLKDYLERRHPIQDPLINTKRVRAEVRKSKVDQRFSEKDSLTWEQASDLLLCQEGITTLSQVGEILRDTPRRPNYDSNGRKIYVYDPSEIGLAYIKHRSR